MKVGLLLYSDFSLYEVTPLTSRLALNDGISVDLIADTLNPIQSEEGFLVLPKYLMSQVNLSDYDLLLLSGTLSPFEAIKNSKITSSLSKVDLNQTVIASISSSPLILAKSGLIDGYRYTGGIHTNLFLHFDWLNEDFFMPRHYYQDRNLTTALGTLERIDGFTNLILSHFKLIDKTVVPNEEDISFTLSQNEFEIYMQEIVKENL